MIVDRKEPVLSSVPLPDEAPPNYEQAVAYPAPTTSRIPRSPAASTSLSSIAGPSSTSHPTAPTSGLRSWFTSFGSTRRAQREVRATVTGLIRELVRAPVGDIAGVAVLASCAEGCAQHGVSISQLLQERGLEGHTPLYWAIVKFAGPSGGSDDASSGARALVDALIHHALPLSSDTAADIREACVGSSDNPLYQRLRSYLGIQTGADRMLLQGAEDAVVVENVEGEESAFVATIALPMFQRRMRIGGMITCDFIARGRLFVLAFIVLPTSQATQNMAPGTWVVSLSLRHPSAATHLDSRLLIEDQSAATLPTAPAAAPSSPDSPLSSPMMSLVRPRTPVEKPPLGGNPLALRLRTSRGWQLGPTQDGITHIESQVTMPIAKAEGGSGAGIEFDGTPYVGGDGVLRARLEAKLEKPASDGYSSADCVIA